MQPSQASEIIGVIRRMWPSPAWEDEVLDMYLAAILDLNASICAPAVQDLIMSRNSAFRPTVGEIRNAYLDRVGTAPPSASEAWHQVITHIQAGKRVPDAVHPAVLQVARSIGHRQLSVGETGTIRAHFLRMYAEVATEERRKMLLAPGIKISIADKVASIGA